jgi:hypothetical protein
LAGGEAVAAGVGGASCGVDDGGDDAEVTVGGAGLGTAVASTRLCRRRRRRKSECALVSEGGGKD